MIFGNGEDDRSGVSENGVDEECRVKEPGVVQVLQNADRDERVEGFLFAEERERSRSRARGRARIVSGRKGQVLKANPLDLFGEIPRDA